MPPHTQLLAAPAPSTPLGPVLDSAITWTTWVTLMGFVGLLALAAVAAGPAAARIGAPERIAVTMRLVRVALVLGVLAVPAMLLDLAHGASDTGGYDFGAAFSALYDGTGAGLLLGLELTLSVLGVALLLPLAGRRGNSGPARPWLLGGGLAAGAIALGTTKFPSDKPTDWGRTSFDTLMWMLHLLGGAVWIGGLIGLLALTVAGAIPAESRSVFWSGAIRRFSISAMGCVAAIGLSGLWLYWEHVDGPGQLFTTMYGRVLGVKILLFGTMALLGMANQFWLHPRIEALRAGGDQRRLRTILVKEFPAVIAVEVILGLGVLMAAPFLHGSARNQAFQQQAAEQATTAKVKLPKIAPKQVSASTWLYGTGETLAVIVIMAGGYRMSGRIVRRRITSVAPAKTLEPV